MSIECLTRRHPLILPLARVLYDASPLGQRSWNFLRWDGNEDREKSPLLQLHACLGFEGEAEAGGRRRGGV